MNHERKIYSAYEGVVCKKVPIYKGPGGCTVNSESIPLMKTLAALLASFSCGATLLAQNATTTPGAIATRVQPPTSSKAIRELIRFGVTRRENRAAAAQAGEENENKAIERALNWFVATQKIDGSWDGGNVSRIGTTGLIMISFMGYGVLHVEPPNTPQTASASSNPKYRAAMAKAVEWMLKQVSSDGSIRDSGRMYDQGIATYALCEAYGLAADASLKDACERAVAFIVKAQNRETGGWRYVPISSSKSEKGDLSVSGFQIMAIESAKYSKLAVPDTAFKLAREFLDSRSGGPQRGLYGYHNDRSLPTPAMTAVGMFCQRLLLESGAQLDVERVKESANYIRANLPSVEDVNYYYWWYGSYAMGYHSDQAWDEWYWGTKERPDYPGLGTILLDRQVKTGDLAGSWSPEGYMAERFGRHITTAFVILMMETPYRFSSLPSFRGFTRRGTRD
jgi:hypothetical protein